MNSFNIVNVRIVTPTEVIDNGSVFVRNGKIERIERMKTNLIEGVTVINGNGQWLLPGLIDLHDDAIEKEIEPRPNAYFPFDPAFFSLENRLASHGITSIFHSLSFADGELGIRSSDRVVSIVQDIHRLKNQGIIRTLFMLVMRLLTENHFLRLMT